MEVINTLRIIRSAFYIWVAAEATLLWYVYREGYYRVKKSAIINALQQMFFFIAIFFYFLAFIPIVQIFDGRSYEALIVFIIPLLLLIGSYMNKFRQRSLEEDKMVLPDKDKEVR